MAARSFFLSALALVCVAALIQVSSGSCLRRNKCRDSFSSYVPDSYQEKCSCVLKPTEKKEFNVYSGMHSNSHEPCKAHYYNVEEPPQEEEPCVALGYGLQVPQPRREALKCSSHGYKVEVPRVEEEEDPRNAYGYLVTQPKPTPPPRCLSVGYQVDAPPVPIPEKTNAYGYAVAVPKRKVKPCISQSFNYHVEAPPPPQEEEKYAYGIAVQTFPKPPPCLPCVDDYEIPDSDPPPPKPCVPCEDDYDPPKPQYSFSIREKSYRNSDCPCDEDDGDSEYHYGSKQYGSGNDYEPRYEQKVQKSYGVTNLRDGGGDSSYEDESPLPGGYAVQGSYGEGAEVSYGGDLKVWGTSSGDDPDEVHQDEEDDPREGASYDSADLSQDAYRGDSQTDYGVTSYDTYSPYHAFFSKVTGWNQGSTIAEKGACGCSAQTINYDHSSNHEGYSSGNTQGYLSATSYLDDSKDQGSNYETNTVQSSISPVTYEEEMGYGGGVGSYGFRDGSFNTPIQISVGKYEEASSKEQGSAVDYSGYSGTSSYTSSLLSSGEDQEKYVDPGSYEQGQQVLASNDGDSYAEDQYPSTYTSDEYENVGNYQQENVGSNKNEGITAYSTSNYPASYRYEEYQDASNYNKGQSSYEAYSAIDPYATSHAPVSYSNEKYDDSISYDQNAGDNDEYSGAQSSFSVVEQPSSYYHDQFEDPGSFENKVAEPMAYSEIKSSAPGYSSNSYTFEHSGDSHQQDSIDEFSYGSKNSYSPVKCPCSALHRKYDGGLSYHSVDSASKYHTSSISAPSHETHALKSYVPFPFQTYHSRKDEHGVVGHKLYEEIHTDGHLSSTFAHGGNVFHAPGHSTFGQGGEHEKLHDSTEEGDTGYYRKNNFNEYSSEEGLGKVEGSTDESHKILKKVVLVNERPFEDNDEAVTVAKVKTIKVSSKEIANEDLIEYVPEGETKVIVTEVISSGEKIGSKGSKEYLEEPTESKKIIVQKIISSSERGLKDDGGEKEIEVIEYTEGPHESDPHYAEDGESVRPTHEDVGSYEVVKKVVDEDGDIVEKEEAAIVETYGNDADRVVVVEDEDKREAEVIVEGEPNVVYEKEVLVKVDDGYGGERVVSKEIITEVRPAVAVEVTVSEPHQHKEKTHSHKKSYSSEYTPRGSYEIPTIEKVVTKPSKHSSKEVTEVIEEHVYSGERKGSHPGKTVTKIYSGERHGGDEVSKVRTALLEKILTEDPEEAIEYTRPSYVSGEKHLAKVHRGSSVEYITRGSGSKEKVVVRKEYSEPEEKGYSVSYETKSSHHHSTHHPGAKKTVIVTKQTSTEIITPKYEPELENKDDEYEGITVNEYINKEPEDPDQYEEVTVYETTEHTLEPGNDKENYQSDNVYVGKTGSKEDPISYSHSYEPHKTIFVTKKSSTDYAQPKHETEVLKTGEDYESGTVYVGKKQTHASEPVKKVVITKKITTEYEEPSYVDEQSKGEEQLTRKVYAHKNYHNEHPETHSYSHKPSGTVVVTKKVTNEYGSTEYKEGGDRYGTPKTYVKKVIVEEPEGSYSYSNARGEIPSRESAAYTKVTKSYEEDPEITKKVFVTKKVSYPEQKPRVEYSNGDDDSDVDVIYKSRGSQTSEYTSPSLYHHDIKHKYRADGEVSLSSHYKPSHSREVYSKASSESSPSQYPKYQHRVYEEDYSPKKSSYDAVEESYEGGLRSNVNSGSYYKKSYPSGSMSSKYDNPIGISAHAAKIGGAAVYQQTYRSSSEHGAYDAPEEGYISAAQGAGYWRSRVHSRAEAVKSHKSAYKTVQVKSGGLNYYGDDDDGTGGQYQSYSSGSSGGSAEGQGYGDFYKPTGVYDKASSRGSMSNSYAMEGGAASEDAVEDQGSFKGYGSGRVKSFVIRQAHGNTKKSSGYQRFEHHVSSSAGGSDTYPQWRSPGS